MGEEKISCPCHDPNPTPFSPQIVRIPITRLTYMTYHFVMKKKGCINYKMSRVMQLNNVQFHYSMLTFIIAIIICRITAASHKFVHALSSLLISLITLLSSLQVSPSLLPILLSCLSSIFSLATLWLKLTVVDISSYFFQIGPVSKTRTESLMAPDNTGQSHVSDSNSFVTIWIRRKFWMTHFCKLHVSF